MVCPVKQGHMPKTKTPGHQLLRVAGHSFYQCVCVRVWWYVGSLDVYTCHADVMHSILILASTRVPIRRQVSIVREKNLLAETGTQAIPYPF